MHARWEKRRPAGRHNLQGLQMTSDKIDKKIRNTDFLSSTATPSLTVVAARLDIIGFLAFLIVLSILPVALG
jgi:hypothetical protein